MRVDARDTPPRVSSRDSTLILLSTETRPAGQQPTTETDAYGVAWLGVSRVYAYIHVRRTILIEQLINEIRKVNITMTFPCFFDLSLSLSLSK